MATNSNARVRINGKFLCVGDEKIYLKGVTYGTFRPLADGSQFPTAEVITKDFEMMAHHGINCVRVYTVPPLHLLDIAQVHGLWVMVGLPWEQHVTFLDNSQIKSDIVRRVREGVLSCAHHPAILCFAVGNEIPGTICRWHGKEAVEKWIRQLYDVVKSVDPEALVTYVNYPTTEYLELGFLDFDCFNVYLETPEKLSAYVSRLHNLAGDRPLVLAEIGLDSLRKGEDQQAETLRWQIETIFGKGCAGMFIFAWTDEWWRGGFDIEDWDFGMVDRQRNAKPALEVVAHALSRVPFEDSAGLPFFSVVICSYNGSATISDALDALMRQDYPNYEVIVVNDGSKDNLAELVRKYPSVKLISTPNRGLSSARNTGWQAASGEIVGYTDDDTIPDVHWLRYLAHAYLHSDHGGIGGSNIPPLDEGLVATCVGNAPGRPVHVLTTDELAEHIPGCNMSFRRSVLEEVGGFDPIYRAAGDDVDICWRVLKAGYTIGFHPGAFVWHHCRNTVKAYWRQQKGYGKAEALLEGKWPEKYNDLGHLSWAGRIYGNGLTLAIKTKKGRVFHGSWGSALFQSVYQPADGFLSALPLMPEWYLFSGLTATVASLGFLWSPLLWLWIVFAASVLVVVVQAAISSVKNVVLLPEQKADVRYRLLIVWLHMIQPMARLLGRLTYGLTPWRQRGSGFSIRYLFALKSKTLLHWTEEWRSIEDWLTDIEHQLLRTKARVRRSGDFDRWDLEVRSGLFSSATGLLTIEEHGAQKQYLKFKCTPRNGKFSMVVLASLATLCLIAVSDEAFVAGGVLLALIAFLMGRVFVGRARAMNGLYQAFKCLGVSGPGGKVEEEMKQTSGLDEEPGSSANHEKPLAEPQHAA